MKSDDSLSRSHWIFKENLIFVWYCDGGESHRLFTSLTLNNYARGKGRSHLKTVDLSRLSLLFPHLFDLNRFDIASTIPWANSCTFLREWRHVIHNSFQPSRRLTSCSPFLFNSSSFSLVPSCCFYPSCTLVHEYNRVLQIRNITR